MKVLKISKFLFAGFIAFILWTWTCILKVSNLHIA